MHVYQGKVSWGQEQDMFDVWNRKEQCLHGTSI